LAGIKETLIKSEKAKGGVKDVLQTKKKGKNMVNLLLPFSALPKGLYFEKHCSEKYYETLCDSMVLHRKGCNNSAIKYPGTGKL
jgi:hypothetical protein